MRVKRDFDRIYRDEQDPWAIGDASDPRYGLYRDLLLSRVRRGRLLDVGCGLGAFLARFGGDFDELTGVETAADAVQRARELHPEIEFVHVAAERMAETPLDARMFDAIIVSDVLYYLRRRARTRLLSWVAAHLAPGGHSLVAGWCPGGRYFEPDEFRALVRAHLRVVDDMPLPSGHVALVGRRKLRLAAFAPAGIAGAAVIPWDDDGDRLAAAALSSLPREQTPERLRLARRLGLRRPLEPTGDELVVIVGEPTSSATAALERKGFALVSAYELAAAARC